MLLLNNIRRQQIARSMSKLYKHSLTHSISSSRSEEIAGLRKSLNELGNALSVTLTSSQRTHHGGQHALHDACEQLRAQRLPSPAGRMRRVQRRRWWARWSRGNRRRLLARGWRKHRLIGLKGKQEERAFCEYLQISVTFVNHWTETVCL